MKSRGFTLIELLVVISIIGLLSSVVLASLNSARSKARDAKRIAELRQLNTAILLYYDQKGFYPPCETHYITNGTTECLSGALISEGLMSRLPVDPRTAGGSGVWGIDFSYFALNPSYQLYNLRGSLEGTPLQQTHIYPGGGTCATPAYPECNWYQTCVYRGYGSNVDCPQTVQYGSQ